MKTKHMVCLVTWALGGPFVLLGACSNDDPATPPVEDAGLLDEPPVIVQDTGPEISSRRDGESGDRLAVESWDGGACEDRTEGRKPGANCRVPQECQAFCCVCDDPDTSPTDAGSDADAADATRPDSSFIPRDGGPRDSGPRDSGHDAGRRAYFAALCTDNRCASKEVTCRSRTANFPYCR